ncbi:PKD domain-containing protein [Actinacidiphila sp. bgisy145]|uniref:PKD domain-containing protein n=1 Tax=Actinacidiphila sp. bgisy145 TaxID=3413792 RepID=UPI003EC103D4
MEFRRRALVCAAVLAGVAGGLAPLAGAAADSAPASLYVAEADGCSVSGPGTQTVPFCTVQEAADVVSPGQTVHIAPGEYSGPVSITRSGTPDAPITFTGTGSNARDIHAVLDVSKGSAPALTLSGVHDVTIAALGVSDEAGTDGVAVLGSQRIALTGDSVSRLVMTPQSPAGPTASFRVDGSSSDVSITRSKTSTDHGIGVIVEAGARDVTVATNALNADTRGGIRATGAVGLVLTGNTVEENPCATGILLDGATTATVTDNALRSMGTGEDNCTVTPLLSVAADTVDTVRGGYNAVDTVNTPANRAPKRPAYSWAGTDYATAAAFGAAVPGLGAHDLDFTDAPNAWYTPPAGSPLIDSADTSAPGITPLDFLGYSRAIDDPEVPDSGTGTGTMDRGAVETQSTLIVSPTYTPVDARCPAPCTVTVGVRTQDSWGEDVSTAVDFGEGDGAQPVTDGTASHQFTVPGTYTATVTATNSDGLRRQDTQQVVIGTPLTPSVSLAWDYTIGPRLDDANVYDSGSVTVTPSFGSGAWQVAQATYDFGDGTAPVTLTGSEARQPDTHRYTAPGTYTATVTTTDLLDRTATASTTYTVGDVVVPQTPVRIYDSRTIANPIPAHGTLTLSRDEFALPDDATVHGFYLTATVTGAKAGGVLSVYPHGTTRPQSSVLNFPAGQNTANTVLAAPGPDGKVDFYNSSAKSIDLVLDQFGVEAGATAGSVRTGDTYSPVSPARILDTRVGTGAAKGAVASKGNVTFKAAGIAGVPSNAAAVVLNLAATDTKAAGHLTAYPHGTTYPSTSNLNWATGQTASNLAVVPLTDGKIVVNNGSTAAADLFADVVGYYHQYGTAAVIVPTPSQVRVLDTRTGAGTAGRIAEVPAKGTVRLVLAGANGLPATGVTAAALNLTVTHQTGTGHIIAYPDGTALPNSSSVNYRAGQTTANAAIVPVGANGAIDLYNSGPSSVDLIADLSGYYYDDPRD